MDLLLKKYTLNLRKKNTIAGQWCFRNVGKDKECEHKIGSNLLYVQFRRASIKSHESKIINPKNGAKCPFLLQLRIYFDTKRTQIG